MNSIANMKRIASVGFVLIIWGSMFGVPAVAVEIGDETIGITADFTSRRNICGTATIFSTIARRFNRALPSITKILRGRLGIVARIVGI